MSNRFEFVVKEKQVIDGFQKKVYIIRDKETGVNYLTFNDGITPLLDRNGKVVITNYSVEI